ncbi:hypothetical protein PR202_ga09025 [Eleusine coracana subsp. coracana]|uniref:Reticulon-like protein n=1 Tax=Eleusine coracana subsp. coracana TaxID=191504 RepID=A0AAV5C468_ELECO|nr:hypothetical protein QOZ80_1AG0040090 [Eleusine coracana subsp. coracana]GJM92547.1 hypothetical protein PR202_ga09025 [Eleusine coracana subsp. coracana]
MDYRSRRLFGDQRSLHDLLGGGTVADVMLWRRKEVAVGLLAAVVASWTLFYCVPGYTLLSFVSQMLMILLTVLFVWAKAAQLLNRAPPPVPLMKISEESMSKAAEIVGNFMNKMLQDFENIALGKDSSLFYKVALVLLLTSLVGRLTDLVNLVYTSLVIALTMPALLEKTEGHIARFLNKASIYIQACERACKEYKYYMKNMIAEKKKLY